MNDRVPFMDLRRIHDPIREDILGVVETVVADGDFILGPAVARFEQEFASYVGTKHAIGVGSGTAALTVATIAAGVEPGLPGQGHVLGPLVGRTGVPSGPQHHQLHLEAQLHGHHPRHRPGRGAGSVGYARFGAAAV